MQFVRQVEREPLEKIRRSPELPGDLSGTVDKSGLVLANAAANAADVFAANAQRMQDDRDKAKVNQAVAGWIKRDQDYKYNKDKGILFKTGADANGLYVKTQDEQDGWRKEISGSLENDRQRQMFAAAIVPHETSSQIEVSKYEASESKKWNAEQADDLVKTQAGVLANGAYKTQEGRAAALATAQQAAATIYGVEQDQEQAAKHVKEQMGLLAVEAYSIMKENDPGSAPAFVESYKDAFDPVTYGKIKAEADKAALPVKAKNLYNDVKGDYAAGMAWIEKNVPAGEKEEFTNKFQSVYSDMDSIKQVTYRKTNEDFAKKYLSRGLSMGDIAGAVKSGALDAAGALTWQNRLEADHDRAVAKAERAAARADALQYRNDLAFNRSLRHMTPVQQQYAEYEHYYGVSPTMADKSYNDAMKRIDSGKLTMDNVAELQANGKILPLQAEKLAGRLQELATVEGKKIDAARTRGRDVLFHLVTKANMDTDVISGLLQMYDDQTIGLARDPKDYVNLPYQVIQQGIDKYNIPRTRLKYLHTDAGKLYDEAEKVLGKTPVAPSQAGTGTSIGNKGQESAADRKKRLNNAIFGK